jgi:hypothetical protein
LIIPRRKFLRRPLSERQRAQAPSGSRGRFAVGMNNIWTCRYKWCIIRTDSPPYCRRSTTTTFTSSGPGMVINPEMIRRARTDPTAGRI